MKSKKILLFIVLLVFGLGLTARAQKAIVQGKPSLQDRYPKKSGNLLFSDLSVSFPRLFDNQTSTQTLRFYNASKYEISLAANNVPAHLSVQLTASVRPQAEGTLVITYDAAKKGDYGFLMDQLNLRTSDSLQVYKTISLATIIEPFVPVLSGEDSLQAPRLLLVDSLYDYKSVKQGETVQRDLRIKNSGQRELKIMAVKTTCGCIGANVARKTLAPGESTTVQISYNSTGKSGRDSHEVIVYSNDPFRNKATIPVQGITMP